MNVFKSSFFWFFVFTILIFLALDFWSWEQPTTFSLFHLPPWIFYFFGLQVLLSLSLGIFSRSFWE